MKQISLSTHPSKREGGVCHVDVDDSLSRLDVRNVDGLVLAAGGE